MVPPTVTTAAATQLDPRTFFLAFSIAPSQEKETRDLLLDMASPCRKVFLEGFFLARSGTAFYGVAAVVRPSMNAVRYFRTTLSKISQDIECCPLTRTHELRMRWVRPDPLIARMRETAQDLEGTQHELQLPAHSEQLAPRTELSEGTQHELQLMASMWKEYRTHDPMEQRYLPAPDEVWGALSSVERVCVQKGLSDQVSMLALETYDRFQADPGGGTRLRDIKQSEDDLLKLGALGKNASVYRWWERLRMAYLALNRSAKLPAQWAEARKLPWIAEALGLPTGGEVDLDLWQVEVRTLTGGVGGGPSLARSVGASLGCSCPGCVARWRRRALERCTIPAGKRRRT
jgi:hypothetical protein